MDKSKLYRLRSLLFFSILLSAHLVEAAENKCQRRILFLPQVHRSASDSEIETKSERFKQIAESQYQIAKFIQKNPALPVFSEQIDTTMNLKSLAEKDKNAFPVILSGYKKTFPKGLPQEFSALNDVQRRSLVSSGGDVVSLMLGKTGNLLKVSENEDIRNKIYGRIQERLQGDSLDSKLATDTELFNLVYTQRERMALQQVNAYFQKNPNTKAAIVIFGMSHDFRRHPDLFPEECVLIPEDFMDVDHELRRQTSEDQDYEAQAES